MGPVSSRGPEVKLWLLTTEPFLQHLKNESCQGKRMRMRPGGLEEKMGAEVVQRG